MSGILEGMSAKIQPGALCHADVLRVLRADRWVPASVVADEIGTNGAAATALLEGAVDENLAFARRVPGKGSARWQYKARLVGRRTYVDLDIAFSPRKRVGGVSSTRRVRLAAVATLADLDDAVRAAFDYGASRVADSAACCFAAEVDGTPVLAVRGRYEPGDAPTVIDAERSVPCNTVTLLALQGADKGLFEYLYGAQHLRHSVTFVDVGSRAGDDGEVPPQILAGAHPSPETGRPFSLDEAQRRLVAAAA